MTQIGAVKCVLSFPKKMDARIIGGETMDDLISRAEAIREARPEYLNPQQEKLASYNQGWNDAIDEYMSGIKALPSAQPVAKDINVPNNDSISRKYAIDNLHTKDPSMVWDTADVEVWVNALPSATRPTGRWEHITVDRNGVIMGITVCTNCGKEPTFTHYYDDCGNYCLSDFCPSCGADMR